MIELSKLLGLKKRSESYKNSLMNMLLKLQGRKRKIRLGFDIDGVICDFTTVLIMRLRDRLNQHFDFNPTEYNFLDPYIDIFEDEIRKGLFADCVPYPEAEIFITRLLEDDRFELFFITARGTEKNIVWTPELKYRVDRDTKRWLKHYFPKFNMKNLIFTNKKDHAIRENKIVSMVEDRKDTAEKLAKVCKSFLITRSWNQQGDLDLDCRRIGSLLDLDLYLEGIVNGEEQKEAER